MHQIAIIDAIGGYTPPLRATLESRFRDLGFDPATEAQFLDETDLSLLDKDATRVGILFAAKPAGRAAVYEQAVQTLLDAKVVVVPAVALLTEFRASVPDSLFEINGMELDPTDTQLEKTASLLLELMGLLRKRRRLFISYKRKESADVAQQLYHALDERGFDAFLDTLSVRSAVNFQEALWHRMTDSDIVVLLYTDTAHESGWVKEEIDRANGMRITVVQVIWPGVPRKPDTLLFEPVYLQDSHFDSPQKQRLIDTKITSLCTLVESLRASSLSRRELDLVKSLQDGAATHSLTTTVQPVSHVDVFCNPNQFARVVPRVGVPDSEALHDCALKPPDNKTPTQLVLLYDSFNVTDHWTKHLKWLGDHVPVRVVTVLDIGAWLDTLCL